MGVIRARGVKPREEAMLGDDAGASAASIVAQLIRAVLAELGVEVPLQV